MFLTFRRSNCIKNYKKTSFFVKITRLFPKGPYRRPQGQGFASDPNLFTFFYLGRLITRELYLYLQYRKMIM